MNKLILSAISVAYVCLFSCNTIEQKPRVIVTTDIQVCCGDPDDIQSLCHILWYADELDIKAIIPEKFGYGEKPGGITASETVIEKYRLDYKDYPQFKKMGFPEPDYFQDVALKKDRESAVNSIINEARKDDDRPLYILVWGNMHIVKEALLKDPSIFSKLRILTIGTNLRAPRDGGDGELNNWNGPGRDEIFDDERFKGLWWIENDWGYNGMFSGLQRPEGGGRPIAGPPYEMMNKLADKGGALGKHLKEVVSLDRVKWAYYFRAGDTPTVLYLLDPNNDADDPSLGSWAGIFQRPFPEERPDYWTNLPGDVPFDFANPVDTWEHAEAATEASYQHLLGKREEMYKDLLRKLTALYRK